MASFRKMKNGKVRVEVCINGHRESKVLPPSKAKSQAREREVELSKLSAVIDNSRTFADLFRRYAKEISPKKRGCHWEQKRLRRFEEDEILCEIRLVKSARKDFEHWLDNRLSQVQSSTVNRELNLLGNCLTWARVWQWMSHNPLKDLQRPKNPPPRERRISEEEIEMMCHVLGFKESQPLTRPCHFVAVAFLFAIETAMRAGEICSLKRSSINLNTRVAKLEKTKNGDDREVLLSNRAVELLKLLPKEPDPNGYIFHLTSKTLDVNFRTYRDKTPIKDLHFHDTRHEATTRLSQLPKMNLLRLAKITGHKDLKYLMIYFNETAEDMVSILDSTKEAPQDKNDGEIIDKILRKLTNELLSLGKSQRHLSIYRFRQLNLNEIRLTI